GLRHFFAEPCRAVFRVQIGGPAGRLRAVTQLDWLRAASLSKKGTNTMQENATRTVVGVFDEYGTAERVARELEQAGIPRESVEVQSNFMTGAAGRVSDRGETHEGGISGFFHRLFGGGDSESHESHYSEAVRRGNAVVCVTVPENQVDRAVDI